MVDDPDDIEYNALSKNIEKILSKRLIKNKAKRIFRSLSHSRKGSFSKPSRKPSFEVHSTLNPGRSDSEDENNNNNNNINSDVDEMQLGRSDSFQIPTINLNSLNQTINDNKRKFSIGDVVVNLDGRQGVVLEKISPNTLLLDVGYKKPLEIKIEDLKLVVSAGDYEIGDKVQARAAASFNYFTGHIIAIHEPTANRPMYTYDVQMLDDADDIQYDTLIENMRKILSHRLIAKKVKKLVTVVKSAIAFGGSKGLKSNINNNDNKISTTHVESIVEESKSDSNHTTPSDSKTSTKRNSISQNTGIPGITAFQNHLQHINDITPTNTLTEETDDFDEEFEYKGLPEIQHTIPVSVKASRFVSRASPREPLLSHSLLL